MEEKIFEIIKEHCQLSSKNVQKSATKEITSHIMEFIKWIGNRGCIYWDYKNRGWFLLGKDGGNHMITPDIEIGTTEKLYLYWLNNVKNK